ncbi:MAG: DUF4846 domain-containing protein, partial [Candidatus Poribacteria bacterium]|nr:DUF4846 domain-containing protein [Candidatus Poribacteria bacterium]
LKSGSPRVMLFNGQLKSNQSAHVAVLDIDTGNANLQQCADFVIRLRAEYLYSANARDRIAFDFTSGDRLAFSDWTAGKRPVVSGNRVTWRRATPSSPDYRTFREYLNTIFTYAGTHSLARARTGATDDAR